MKIGVWFGDTLQKTRGGAFSYTDRLIKLIDDFDFGEIDVCFLGLHSNTSLLNKEVIPISLFSESLYKQLRKCTFIYKFVERIDKYLLKKIGLTKILKKQNVGIIYYLTQSYCFDSKFPFIATNWDIGHCSTYNFPEIMENIEYRNYYYRTILPKALMILCDSETGKKELIRYTNIGEHKMRVFPIFAGEVTQLNVSQEKISIILEKYDLENNGFFFYPAQFWAHKNHYNLLMAFKKFLISYPYYKLVLCGSDKGNLCYVKTLIEQLHIEENVLILGFVSIETIFSMYANATALVMASHFGPTNMPPIEAMELGCPVACSDLGGHKEILGDSAVYFDSYNPESICSALVELQNNREMYQKRIILQQNTTNYRADKSMLCLKCFLEEAVEIRKNWGF